MHRGRKEEKKGNWERGNLKKGEKKDNVKKGNFKERERKEEGVERERLSSFMASSPLWVALNLQSRSGDDNYYPSTSVKYNQS